MLAKNDEEKRSQSWRVVMSVSTVLIIVIAAFFLVKLFSANPLEGIWIYEDNGLVMTVKSSGKAMITWTADFEEGTVSMETPYSIDKELKTFTLVEDEQAIEKAAEESENVTEEELRSLVSALEGTYDYSIENGELTLTDREYGEQMVFEKQ